MSNTHKLAFFAFLTVVIVGCGQQQAGTNDTMQKTTNHGVASTPKTARSDGVAQSSGPEAAAREFLEAIRTGNDKKATEMLSTVAQQKTAALNRNVTPPASDTAKFTIGKLEYVGQDGARVTSIWTDTDGDGQPRSDTAIWVLRREAAGWRIAGVAAEVFPGEPPLLLNFEDPEDMFRKQQWVREEIRRRMEKERAGLQAQEDEKAKKSVRR